MGHKIGIDVGGTFTDFILAGHDADVLIHKVLSIERDRAGEEAGIERMFA